MNIKYIAAGLGMMALGSRLLKSPAYHLQGRSVIITGGSRGLGLALAEELLRHQAKVCILARDSEELQLAHRHLKKRYPQAQVLSLVCDVNEADQLRSVFRQTQDRFGSLDVLINNAGSVSAGPFEAMNLEDFEAQMNLHFFAVLKSVQAILPIFKHQGEGRIVNISSIGGKIPVPHMSPYCASKFALAGFSQTLAAELRKDRIHVTTIYPGLMRTGSPIQGVFKGDSEKEFAWFAISDSMPGLTVSAQSAAHRITEAIVRSENEVVISLPAKLGVFAYSVFPQTYTRLMDVVNRFLPQSTSQQRRTGAQSQEWLSNQSWTWPLRKILHRSQVRYNEWEKFDPEFNLNVTH